MSKIIAKGKLINSKKGIEVEVSSKTVIVTDKKTNKKAEKEFVVILFSEKPSQTILDSLKLKNFHYFNQDKTWSAYRADRSEKFALSLIRDEKAETKATKPTNSGKGKKPSIEDMLQQMMAKMDAIDDRLTALETKKNKKK